MSLSPDDAPSAFFSAGRPHTVSVIGGTIRAGRDRATRAELLTRLSEARTAITGQDARSLVVGLNEIDLAFDAPFRGSMGGTRLNKPVTGMVRYGDGYLMVAEDGGIFDFSSSPFAGSLGSHAPAVPIVSVASF